MAEEQARLKIVVSGWMEGDQDLLRHALVLEERIKEQARLEEEERKQQVVRNALCAEINNLLAKHIGALLAPSTVSAMEAEVQRFVYELEVRAGVAEDQRIAKDIRLEQLIHGELTLTLPARVSPYIVLELNIGDEEKDSLRLHQTKISVADDER